MRKLIYLILLLAISHAQARECWTFTKFDKEAQLSLLTISLEPTENVRASEHFRIAKLTVKDLNGHDLSGHVGCSKVANSHWSCVRSDDGGSFELKIDGALATLSTSYFVMGKEDDQLTLKSENDDPWVFTGEACLLKRPDSQRPILKHRHSGG